ncbi:MAG: ChaN family lipoprotein [Hyphomicrobiales bacterium]|nr:ChaN family lipoprotein [Hyphomicrobiales bacterium]MCP5370783.1 ChaN family lipoprotein [Hyphomicrobiales bacterium]
MTRRRATAFGAGLATALAAAMALAPPDTHAERPAPGGADCVPVGRWLDVAGGELRPVDKVMAGLARRSVVLLGETHTNPDHHRWQLQVIAALHGRNPNLVLAFESFPRAVQPALDAWTRGELDGDAFLARTRWNEVWRYDPALYMPLFQFARLNLIPMVAMNVERDLIGRVRDEGWDAVPEAAREGVTTPRPAEPGYVDMLRDILSQHRPGDDGGDKKPAMADDDPGLQRFVQAQTTWDAAMAQKVAQVAKGPGAPLVVGIVGQGHLQYRYGIPHQLAGLGIPDAAVLLPWDRHDDCAQLRTAGGRAVADTLFGVVAPQATVAAPKPRLGVMIAQGKAGVRVAGVVDGSVAAAAGLAKDDEILTAAGYPTPGLSDLVDIVKRMAPGTWLPLTVRRGATDMEIIAKFPKRD